MNRPTTHRELRAAFLDYFAAAKAAHTRVRSAPLIPQSDPTLLFVNAGMVPFKRYFVGEEAAPWPRAVSCQKCVRAGGKHNDLENVGHTARHHTFFEMLGNFSFGDYFKREAIRYAWDFLVERVGLDADRLWITVYADDAQARQLWRDEVGLDDARILDGDATDNFWSMGDTGPCGPCSEIHYDQGQGDHWHCPDPSRCGVFCECDRYLEVWNLVFMQYDRQTDGELKPLPNPSIDTGMGLERLAAIVQGKPSNYETDLFAPLFAVLAKHFDRAYGEDPQTDTAMRVIADHGRAAAFLIADGVLPGNEGRGYVLRRILRRAIRYARNANVQAAIMPAVAEAVCRQLGDHYPELVKQQRTITHVLALEEQRFQETLEQGLRLFSEALDALQARGERVLPGDVAFRLYDTFGFPLDLTALMAREAGIDVDTAGFDAKMDAQRRRARAAAGGAQADGAGPKLAEQVGTTEFVGYEHLTSAATVLALQRAGEPVDVVHAPADIDVVVERTPFYAESGGQVADRGRFVTPNGAGDVYDVQREAGVFFHRVKLHEGTLALDDPVELHVDAARRAGAARHHTATHLLQAALREILGTHVGQSGSLVEPTRLRFDFSHYEALEPQIQTALERRINEMIQADQPVLTTEMSYDEAVTHGALAFFGEKYGSTVRVVEVPDTSVELCGGTHVRATGEIGPWILEQETGVAAGVRRIEAVAGETSIARVQALKQDLDAAAARLKVPRQQVIERIDQVLATVDAQHRELQRLRDRAAAAQAAELADRAVDCGPIQAVAAVVDEGDMDALKTLADRIRERLPAGAVWLVGKGGKRPLVFVSVPHSEEMSLDAGELLREAAAPMGARGGGKGTTAQGGGGDAARAGETIDAFLAALRVRVPSR